MLSLLLASNVAMAQDAAYYHPQQIAEQSQVFVTASETSAPKFQESQTIFARFSNGLEELEVGVLVTASRLDDSIKAHAEEMRREIMASYLQTSAHVELLQTDYMTVFTAALERALATDLGTDNIVECGATGIAALTGRSSCQGTDLNGKLASIIDQDVELKTAIDEINGVPWPTIDVPIEAQAPIAFLSGDSSDVVHIQGAILGNTFLQDRIIAHQDRLDRSLEPLEDGLNNGDTAAVTRAKELRKEYEVAIGADGEALLVLVEEHLARLQKKGGFGAVSLCVNPAELGGCTGNDSSKELISLLQNDRKFAKAMGSL